MFGSLGRVRTYDNLITFEDVSLELTVITINLPQSGALPTELPGNIVFRLSYNLAGLAGIEPTRLELVHFSLSIANHWNVLLANLALTLGYYFSEGPRGCPNYLPLPFGFSPLVKRDGFEPSSPGAV